LSTTLETKPKPKASVEEAAQSSEAEVSGAAHKEVKEAVSRGPVNQASNREEDRTNTTTSEAAEEVEGEEVEDSAGETMTSHNETEILLSLFALAG